MDAQDVYSPKNPLFAPLPVQMVLNLYATGWHRCCIYMQFISINSTSLAISNPTCFPDAIWTQPYQFKPCDGKKNKTQRQLCKRLAGPFIPFSWSCLVWKRVLLWIWSLGGSQQPFFCVLGHFRHGHEQTNNRVILVQACPWPVWEGSLLQFLCPLFYHSSLNFL